MPREFDDEKLSAIKRKRSPSPTIVNPHSYNLRIKPFLKLIKDDSPQKKTPLPKTFKTQKESQRPKYKVKRTLDRCSLCSHFLPIDSSSCVCFSCQIKYSAPRTFKSSRRSLSLESPSPGTKLVGEKQKAINNVPVFKAKDIVSVIKPQKYKYLARSRRLALSACYKGLSFKKKSTPKLNSIENDLLEIKRMSEASNIELQRIMAQSEESRKLSKKKNKCYDGNKIDDTELTISSASNASSTKGSSKPRARTPIRNAKRLKYDENEASEIANEDLLIIKRASSSERLSSTEKVQKQHKKKTRYKHNKTGNHTAASVNKNSTVNEAFPIVRHNYPQDVPKRSAKKDYAVKLKDRPDLVPDLKRSVRIKHKNEMKRNKIDKDSKDNEPIPKQFKKNTLYVKVINKTDINSEETASIEEKALSKVKRSKSMEQVPKRSKKKNLSVDTIAVNGTDLHCDETASSKEKSLSKVCSSNSIERVSKQSKKLCKSKDEMETMIAKSASLSMGEEFFIDLSSDVSEEELKRSAKKTEHEKEMIRNEINLVPNEIYKARSSKSAEIVSKPSRRSSTISEILLTRGSAQDLTETSKESVKTAKHVGEIQKNDLLVEEAVSPAQKLKSIEPASKQSMRSKYKMTCDKTSTIIEPFAGSSKTTKALKISPQKTDLNPNNTVRKVRSSKSFDHASRTTTVISKKKIVSDEQKGISKNLDNSDGAYVLPNCETSLDVSECISILSAKESECANMDKNNAFIIENVNEVAPVTRSSKTSSEPILVQFQKDILDGKITNMDPDISDNGTDANEVLSVDRLTNSFDQALTIDITSAEPMALAGKDEDIQENTDAGIAITSISKINEASAMSPQPSEDLLIISIKKAKGGQEIHEKEFSFVAKNATLAESDEISLMGSSQSFENLLLQSKNKTKIDHEAQKEETTAILINANLTSSESSEYSFLHSENAVKCFDGLQGNKTAELTSKDSSTASLAERLCLQTKCNSNFQGKETDKIVAEACSFVNEASLAVISPKTTEQQTKKMVACDSEPLSSDASEIIECIVNVTDAACPTINWTQSASETRSNQFKFSKENELFLNSACRTPKESDIDVMPSCSPTEKAVSPRQNKTIKSPDLNKKSYVCNVCHEVYNYRQRFRFHHSRCNQKSKAQNIVSVENDSSTTEQNLFEARIPEFTDKFNQKDVSVEHLNKINSKSDSSQISLPDLTEENKLQEIEEKNVPYSCSPSKDSLQHQNEEKSLSNATDTISDTMLPCLKTNDLFFNSTESSLDIQNWANPESKNGPRFNITDLALSSMDSSLEIQNWVDSEHATEPFFNTTDIIFNTNDTAFSSVIQTWENTEHSSESTLNVPELSLNTGDSSLGNQNWGNTICRTELALKGTSESAQGPQVNLEDFESLLQDQEPCLEDLEVSSESTEHKTDLAGSKKCLEGTVASLNRLESPLVEVSSPVERLESSLPESNLVMETTAGSLEEEVVPIIELSVFNPLATNSTEVEFEISNSDSIITGPESDINHQGEPKSLQTFEYGPEVAESDVGRAGTSSERQANSISPRASDKNLPSQFCPKIVDFFSIPNGLDNIISLQPENSSIISKSPNKETAVPQTKAKMSNSSKKTSASAQRSEMSSIQKHYASNALSSSKQKRKVDSTDAKQTLLSKGSSELQKKGNSHVVFKKCCSCGKSFPIPSPSDSIAEVDNQSTSNSSNIACQACHDKQNTQFDLQSKFINNNYNYYFSKFLNKNQRITKRNIKDTGIFRQTEFDYLTKSNKANNKQIKLNASSASSTQVGAANSSEAEESFDCVNTFAASSLTTVNDSVGYLPDTPSSSLCNPRSPLSCTSLSDPAPQTALAESEVEDSVGNLSETPSSYRSNPISPTSCASFQDPIVASENERSFIASSENVTFIEDFRIEYDILWDRAADHYSCYYCLEELKKNEISEHFDKKHDRTSRRNCFNLLAS